MPGAIYRLFAWAIQNETPIACRYNGLKREICPIILGRNQDGEEAALVWQTGGATSKGRLREQGWKCFLLQNVTDAQPRPGPWRTGSSHQRSQACVKDVDYDANRASPYRPQHSLGDLRGVPL